MGDFAVVGTSTVGTSAVGISAVGNADYVVALSMANYFGEKCRKRRRFALFCRRSDFHVTLSHDTNGTNFSSLS